MHILSAYCTDAPAVLYDFLTYMETVRKKSNQTVYEYYLDLRLFFRFLKRKRGMVSMETPFADISISDIDIAFLQKTTLGEAYDFLDFIAQERKQRQNSPSSSRGLGSAARARKISSIRAFFRYATDKAALFDNNPVVNLTAPAPRKTVPQSLTMQDSVQLLQHVSGAFASRDFCILTFFLNCGMRVSELVNINLSDIDSHAWTLRISGKGKKERVLYLNAACQQAYITYLPDRIVPDEPDQNALFISKQHHRIHVQTVKWLVKKYLTQAGLDGQGFSVHKLRHTAATLMYQNGVDVRTLQTVLGHANLDTTRIYTQVKEDLVLQATAQNPLANITSQTAEPTAQSSNPKMTTPDSSKPTK